VPLARRPPSIFAEDRSPAFAAYPRNDVIARRRRRRANRASAVRPCSRRGLPCRSRRRERGGLLPHLFTLTRASRRGRFAFCCAVCRAAVAGRAPGR